MSSTQTRLIFGSLISSPRMTTEPNNDNNEDYSPATSEVSSNTSDKDLLMVFKALESIGFKFIDHYEN